MQGTNASPSVASRLRIIVHYVVEARMTSRHRRRILCTILARLEVLRARSLVDERIEAIYADAAVRATSRMVTLRRMGPAISTSKRGTWRGGRDLEPSVLDEETKSALGNMFGRGLVYTAVYAAASTMGIVITPIITRALGPRGFGQFTAVLTVCQVVQLVAGLGLIAGVQRHFADEQGDDETRGLVALAAVAALVIVAVLQATLAWWAPLLGFAHSGGVLAFGIWWAGVATLGATLTSLLRAQDRLVALRCHRNAGSFRADHRYCVDFHRESNS